MDLVNLLSKLQAIEVQEGLSDKQKEIAKQAGDPDKIEGKDFAALRGKKKANEDIENVLRGLMAIQEGPEEEDNEEQQRINALNEGPEEEEDNEEQQRINALNEGPEEEDANDENEKIAECGDMEMSPLTAPTAGYDMTPMAAMAPQAAPVMAQQEEKPMFTLTVRNGENNLSMTTDAPEEIIHVMKLAGVQGKTEVKKVDAPEQGQAKEVEEAWANTPDQTGEKEPKAYGDIRDWGFKGTGKGKPGYPGTKASGDNPLAEESIIKEYKSFKFNK